MGSIKDIPLLGRLISPRRHSRSVWPYLSREERQAQDIDDLARRVSARLYEERERAKEYNLKIIVHVTKPYSIKVAINGFPTSSYTDRIAFLEFKLDEKIMENLIQDFESVDLENKEDRARFARDCTRKVREANRNIKRKLQNARRAIECIVASHSNIGYEYKTII